MEPSKPENQPPQWFAPFGVTIGKLADAVDRLERRLSKEDDDRRVDTRWRIGLWVTIGLCVGAYVMGGYQQVSTLWRDNERHIATGDTVRALVPVIERNQNDIYALEQSGGDVSRRVSKLEQWKEDRK